MSEEYNEDFSESQESIDTSSDSIEDSAIETDEIAEEETAEMEAEVEEAEAEAEAEAEEIAEEETAEMEAEVEEAEAEADEIAEEETSEMDAEAEEAQAEAETGEREDDITTLYCINKDEEQYDMDGEERFRCHSEVNEECYGHGGDDMITYDPYASYPESHFSETDERYMDEQAEMTEAINQKALRELKEFQRLQDEEAEMEAEQEAEAQRQAEMEKELEKKQEKYKDLDLEYKQIKNDIEISRSSEERAYWEKRAEEIWQERDRVGGEIEDYIRNK